MDLETAREKIGLAAQQFILSGEALRFAASMTIQQMSLMDGSCAAIINEILSRSGVVIDLNTVIDNVNLVPNWIDLVAQGLADPIDISEADAGDIVISTDLSHIGIITSKSRLVGTFGQIIEELPIKETRVMIVLRLNAHAIKEDTP